MRKVFVDREDIEAVRNTLANGGQAVSVLRWAESILAQPAEAEGVDLQRLAAEFDAAPDDAEWEPPHPIFQMAAENDRLNAALSAVTAERDRLLDMHTDKAIAEFEAWWDRQPHREQFEDVKDQMRNVWLASRRELVIDLPERFDKYDSGDWTYWADGVDAAIEAAGVTVRANP